MLQRRARAPAHAAPRPCAVLDCAEMVRCYGRCLQRGRDGREDEEALLRYREQLFNIAKSVSDTWGFALGQRTMVG